MATDRLTVPARQQTVTGGAMPPVLEVNEVSVSFGGVAALTEVSFSVDQGETCGLIGPNGAGKTTLFNCISGIYQPRPGSISIDGANIAALKPQHLTKLGVGRTFQNVALFPNLTVVENVMIGAHSRMHTGFVEAAIGSLRSRREEEETRAIAMNLIDFVDMNAKAKEKVSSLPFGYQKRIELARALATRPKLLLLDEPAAGLNPLELDELKSLIIEIRARFGVAILLVEHHLGLVFALAQKMVVLNFGRKIADGTPDQVRNDPEVVRSYLGDKP